MRLNLVRTLTYQLKHKKISTRCLFNEGLIPRSKQTLHDQISLFRFIPFCQVVATVTLFNKFDNILSLKQKLREQIVIKCSEVLDLC